MDFTIFVWNALTGDVIELTGFWFVLMSKMLWLVMYNAFDMFFNVIFFFYPNRSNRFDRFSK